MDRTLTISMGNFDLHLPDIALLPNVKNIFGEIFKVLGIPDCEESHKLLALLIFKASHFISTRNERSDDLQSYEIMEAMEIKTHFFPIGTPRFLICIDGRVLTMLIACLRGNSYHVPAGDTKIDFLPLKNSGGKLFLKAGFLSKMIDKVVTEQGCIHEVLDSHLHCAAGGLGANDRHCCEVADAGLWDDVVRKSEKKRAIIEYVKEKYGDAKVFVTQMSFNPDNGYSFFGLDKKECLAIAEKAGYTNEIIDSLVKQNLIISTEKLAKDSFYDIFLKHFFVCDYPNNYRKSTKNFWNNFQLMAPEILPIVEAEIRSVLLLEDEKEIKQTASLILASAYNGFLHNHNADGSKKAYQYANHRESVITVTVSEKGPYSGAESFFVHPDSLTMSGDIKLGRNLIVGNRHKKRMSELEIQAVNQVYGDKYNTYTKSPVLAFFFQRTRKELSPEDIAKLESIDWSDVVYTDWFELSNEDFLETYLEKKWPGIPAKIAYTINRLRKQAQDFYAPNQEATEDMLSGRIIPICTIACPNRKILSIIPFIINGYKK